MIHLDLLTRLRQEVRFTLTAIEESTLAVAERVNRKVQLMRLHWQASHIQTALTRIYRQIGEAVCRAVTDLSGPSESPGAHLVPEDVVRESLPQVQAYKEQLGRINVQVGVLRSEFVHDDLIRYYRDLQVRGETFTYVAVARGSSCIGLPFDALGPRYDVRVLMVVRGVVLLNPTDRSMFRVGDHVALAGSAQALMPCVAQLTASRATECLA